MDDDGIEQIAHGLIKGQHDASKLGYMVMWTVYRSPRDYPDQYVARKWLVGGKIGNPVSTQEKMVAGGVTDAHLADMRKAFEFAGFVRLARSEGDEPQIVESWI